MNIGNPLLEREQHLRVGFGKTLTINGVVNKTGFSLIALGLAFMYTWHMFFLGEDVTTLTMIGGIGGFILALIIIFAKLANPFMVLAYAALEGLFLGGISGTFEAQYSGIVMQAVLLTFACFIGILVLYKMNVIRYSAGMVRFIMVSLFGIVIAYVISFIGGFFGMPLSFLHDSSPLSIGISLFIVGIATLSFIIDFEAIKRAAENQVDRKQEWYFCFSLLVSLVWLYLEILRLLAKLRGRR